MNKYRIISDGKRFRVEIHESWNYRGGWFWLKKITQEQWVLCDFSCQTAVDDNGELNISQVENYNTLEDAQAAIKKWTTLPKIIDWKIIWPTNLT